jgi:alanine dehydrogenase
MMIGVPREQMDGERRVGLVPVGAAALVANGHQVAVEKGAGERVGFGDAAYAAAGARIVSDAAAIFCCPLIVKIKELQRAELQLLQPGTTVFCYAQLGRDREVLDAVLAARIGCIGYETVTDAAGALPLLAPMSRISGRLAPLIAATLLMTDRGGSGVLLPGLDDIAPGHVVIVGAGNVGGEAAFVAGRLGCSVTVFARTGRRLDGLRERCGPRVQTALCEPAALAAALATADVVIGAVLERGRLSPRLISRAMVRAMRKGSVLIDVGIGQGGMAETSRMTALSAPTYVDEGVVHYCVPNIPALVARTATLALTQATLPYVQSLADRGIGAAVAADTGLRAGVQVWDGGVCHPGLAADAGLPVSRSP